MIGPPVYGAAMYEYFLKGYLSLDLIFLKKRTNFVDNLQVLLKASVKMPKICKMLKTPTLIPTNIFGFTLFKSSSKYCT